MSQLISSLQLSTYPVIAMILFLSVFVLSLLGIVLGRGQRDHAAIPLSDGTPAPTSTPSTTKG